MLGDVLFRISESLGMNRSGYLKLLARSFLVSADNAHAVHPNHPEYADPDNRPVLNGGIVIKFNANQRYCTDAFSAGVFREICRRAGVPTQVFSNRSDMPGGSTLGNISNTHVSMETVDIGLAQLAMHSAWETAGTKDLDFLVRALSALY
jgi:aspartyl aminopeptidase